MGEDTVEIRPARREDRRRIEELLHEANGGYYPLIDELDSWIDDEVGQFCVAIADGSVVGCSRLARLAPGEWWGEGLAVDPEYRRRGIMRQMFHYRLALWRRIGSGHHRGLIAGYNTAVLRMLEEAGHRVVVRYVHLTAAAECGEHAFTVLTPGQAGWAYERLRARPFLQASNGLIERRGRCQTLTREYFDTLVRAGEVFAWRENQGVACARWRPELASPELRVWIAEGESGIDVIGRELRSFAFARSDGQMPTVEWRVPDESTLVKPLEAVGYSRRTGY